MAISNRLEASPAPPAPEPIRLRRALLILASALGIATATTAPYSLGLFVAPLQHEFGWSRAEVTSGLTIASLLGTLLAPLVGLAVDRYGPRRIAVFGTIAHCAVLALLGATGRSIWTWWALWTLLAFAGSLVSPLVWTAMVSASFTRRRGLALALALCGTGLGSALTPTITDRLIAALGWRLAYPGLAVIWGAVALPIIIAFFRRTAPRPLLPGAVLGARLAGADLRTSYRSPRFFKLAAAAFFATITSLSVMIHFVPLLQDHGIPTRLAAQLTGIFGLASIVGRTATGMLLDRFHGPAVGATVLVLPSFACALLLVDVNTSTAVVAAIVLGLALGGEVDIVTYLTTRYFGLRHFGALFGAISSMFGLATAMGPLLAAFVFDRFQSYDPWLWAMIPCGLFASLAVGTLGAYPREASALD